MVDRLVDVGDDLDGQDRRQVFGVPVFLGGGGQVRIAGQDRARFVVGAQFDLPCPRTASASCGSTCGATARATSSVSIVLQVP